MIQRRMAAVAVACALMLGSACGRNRVELDIDVLSFMEPSDTQREYQAAPLVPTTARIDPVSVQLLEGYDDLGIVQEATLDVGVRWDNESGSGQGRIAIYFGTDAATVYDTAPVAIIDADLLPANQTVGTAAIQADARVLELFTSREFFMGLDLEWNPDSVDPLAGTCTLIEIRAHVVSELDLL
jgi:hypothetical protein